MTRRTLTGDQESDPARAVWSRKCPGNGRLPFAISRAAIARQPYHCLAYLLNGLGVADGLLAGVAVGLASGVAVGIAVGDGAGVAPGFWFGAAGPFVLAPDRGVITRSPEGMPGAAGRIPSGLASVESVRLGAGPEVAGAVAESPP